MDKIKTKILNYLFRDNEGLQKEYYKKHLENLYEKHKEFFESLFIKDFIGYIPKDVNEPALKIFEEHAELFQRWVLWQSYYINRKALHDPIHIPKYDGMMIYLKVLHVMAEANKKSMPVQKQSMPKVEKPWLDSVMEDLQDINQKYANKINKNNSGKGTKGGKVAKTDSIEGEDAEGA